MRWVLLTTILIILYYFAILKPGRFDFWKVAGGHPDEVFEMFQQHDCWCVFVEKPQGGYKSELPDGEWDGPFKLAVPKLGGQIITVYGKVPDYKKAQQVFMNKRKGTT